MWFAIVSIGDYGGPTGPWPSAAKAMAAWQAWFDRTGFEQNVAANSPRLVGPYPTKEAAAAATIATADRVVRPLF